MYIGQVSDFYLSGWTETKAGRYPG